MRDKVESASNPFESSSRFYSITKSLARTILFLIQISTPSHNGLYDITPQVETIVAESGLATGMVNVYVQGATAGIMVLFIFMYPD